MNTPPNTHTRFLPFALILMGLTSTIHAEFREFKSAKGQVIKAELKKAKGQTILLKGFDGKDLQIPLASFSKDDQTFILKWIAHDPTAIDYNFVCKVDEKLLESVKMRGYYERSGIQRKAYQVAISNGSRNAVDGMAIEYRVFFEDKVKRYSSGSGLYANEIPQVLYKTGETDLPTLNYNNTFNLLTKGYSLETLKEYYYYGNRGTLKDRLLGIWIRFYRHGHLVQEWKSPGVPKCEWPGGTKQKPRDFSEEDTPPVIADNGSSSNSTNPSGTKPAPTQPTAPLKKEEEDSGSDDDATVLKMFELDDESKGKK